MSAPLIAVAEADRAKEGGVAVIVQESFHKLAGKIKETEAGLLPLLPECRHPIPKLSNALV
jgi:hypothetical protein